MQTEVTLPPLPESDLYLCFYDEGGMQETTSGAGYSTDQMRSYALQAVIEDRAKRAPLNPYEAIVQANYNATGQ